MDCPTIPLSMSLSEWCAVIEQSATLLRNDYAQIRFKSSTAGSLLWRTFERENREAMTATQKAKLVATLPPALLCTPPPPVRVDFTRACLYLRLLTTDEGETVTTVEYARRYSPWVSPERLLHNLDYYLNLARCLHRVATTKRTPSRNASKYYHVPKDPPGVYEYSLGKLSGCGITSQSFLEDQYPNSALDKDPITFYYLHTEHH